MRQDEWSFPPVPVITLTTDFGVRDPYTAAMKGVIRTRCPFAHIEDLSHEITPQNILEGALFWAAAIPYWPQASIHVGVIDPEVGTERAPLAARAGGRLFVCPDNGLLTLLLADFPLECAYCIVNPEFMLPAPSSTFHGRDIFAPAAAQLAAGTPLEEAGPPLETLRTIEIAAPVFEEGLIHGEVIHIDHFGNAVTNISRKHLEPGTAYRVQAAAITLPGIWATYAAAAPGKPLALFGGGGQLEIAVRNGNAHRVLDLTVGAPVTLYRP